MSGSIRLTGRMGLGLSGGGLRYPGAVLALDFAKNTYEIGGRKRSLADITFARASAASYYGPDGLLATASSGVIRIAYDPTSYARLGYQCEEGRTNAALWNRDLTNAAWTKSSATAAKDQTGIDGVANSASSLTATGANGTCLQAITLGSSARFQSTFIKRMTGSGAVEMTMDNGSTWTAVTVTAGWTRVVIPTQTLANPTVGFRVVTSGDAVAIDHVANENASTGPSSPIATTTVAVARVADVGSISGLSIPFPCTIITEWVRSWDAGGSQAMVTIDSGSAAQRVLIYVDSTDRLNSGMDGGASAGAVSPVTATVAGTIYKGAVRFSLNDMQAAIGGVLGTVDTSANYPTSTLTTLRIGTTTTAGIPQNGIIRRIIVLPCGLTDAQLQSVST